MAKKTISSIPVNQQFNFKINPPEPVLIDFQNNSTVIHSAVGGSANIEHRKSVAVKKVKNVISRRKPTLKTRVIPQRKVQFY